MNIKNLPSLSEKDREFVEFAAEQDIDFIAHSFVRKKEDLLVIQDDPGQEKQRCQAYREEGIY